MAIRLTPTLILPAVLGAAVAGYVVYDHASADPPPRDDSMEAAAMAATAPPPASPPMSPSTPLPPNHPAVGGMSPHGAHGGMGGLTNSDNDAPASITWTVPSGWTSQANPSAMRLATYKVGDGAQMSVMRAGGTVDANVERWQQQFEGSPKAERTSKQVHGLPVTIVRIRGTFLGGGMGAQAPEKQPGWEMLAAVVESQGAPYFFKLLGTSDQVERARGAFDTMVGTLAPKLAGP